MEVVYYCRAQDSKGITRAGSAFWSMYDLERVPSLDGPFYYRHMTDFEGTARTEHNREDHCVVPSKFVMRR